MKVNKKAVFIIVGITLWFAVVEGIIFLWKAKVSGQPQQSKTEELNTLVPSSKLLHMEDPTGLAFDYPSDLTINKHDEDKDSYAHIEFTHQREQGRVIVWVNDLPVNENGKEIATIDDWISMSKELREANSLDTKLAGSDAKKVFVPGSPEKIVTLCLYDSLLWKIEAEFGNRKFWQSVYDTISGSFAFIEPVYEGEETGEAVVDDTDAEEYADEEEVLE